MADVERSLGPDEQISRALPDPIREDQPRRNHAGLINESQRQPNPGLRGSLVAGINFRRMPKPAETIPGFW